MTVRVRSHAALLLALIAAAGFACHDSVTNPIAPRGIQARFEWPTADTVAGTAGAVVAAPISVLVTDRNGAPVAGVPVEWTVYGTEAAITPLAAQTDARGRVAALWKLGTHTSESQIVEALVRPLGEPAIRLTRWAVAGGAIASHVVFDSDSMQLALGQISGSSVHAYDAFGNKLPDSLVRVSAADTSIAIVSTDGAVRPRRRGRTFLIAAAARAADTIALEVYQRVAAIQASLDTVRFAALTRRAHLAFTPIDESGLPVRDTTVSLRSADPSVASVVDDTTILAVANGEARVTGNLGAVTRAIAVIVRQLAARVAVTPALGALTALGDTIRLNSAVVDSAGVSIAQRSVTYATADTANATVSADGLVTARAAGRATIVATLDGTADTAQIDIQQAPTALVHTPDAIVFRSLGATQSGLYWAVDRSGARIGDAPLRYAVGDTNLLRVDAAGRVVSKANGRTFLHAWVSTLHDSVLVTVRQAAVRIVYPSDTLNFDALRQTRTIAAIALDSLGSRVADTLHSVAIDSAAVVQLRAGAELLSLANGTARATFTLAGLAGALPIRVRQVADSITVSRTDGDNPAIIVAALNAPLPFRCISFDRNGFAIDSSLAVQGSRNGVYAGVRCDSLRLAKSGRDTLTVATGRAIARFPFAAAARPVIAPGLGTALALDSAPPAGSYRWAPTLRRNSRGEFELYAALYTYTPAGDQIGDLNRWTSTDGQHFKWDGVVIHRDTSLCAPKGTGIENVAIVPRQEAAGWRMFFAAGSFNCYGWQVFSAVSNNERDWVVEPGVRLTNGSSLDSPAQGQWPVGEGMSVDQLPNGEWRMIVGGYEQATPPYGAWQIVEWRSSDQLNWRYIGPVLRTRDMPNEIRQNVYSPSVSLIGPGVYRMFFTGDNRYDVGGRARLWSAVSLDARAWQLEGELVGADGWNIRYVSWVAGSVVYLRRASTDTADTLTGAVLLQPSATCLTGRATSDERVTD